MSFPPGMSPFAVAAESMGLFYSYSPVSLRLLGLPLSFRASSANAWLHASTSQWSLSSWWEQNFSTWSPSSCISQKCQGSAKASDSRSMISLSKILCPIWLTTALLSNGSRLPSNPCSFLNPKTTFFRVCSNYSIGFARYIRYYAPPLVVVRTTFGCSGSNLAATMAPGVTILGFVTLTALAKRSFMSCLGSISNCYYMYNARRFDQSPQSRSW